MQLPTASAATQRREFVQYCLGFALAMIPSLVPAQTTDTAAGSLLQEITVTATKREQSVQDVGIAIAAYTSEQLQQLALGTVPTSQISLPAYSLAAASAARPRCSRSVA